MSEIVLLKYCDTYQLCWNILSVKVITVGIRNIFRVSFIPLLSFLLNFIIGEMKRYPLKLLSESF